MHLDSAASAEGRIGEAPAERREETSGGRGPGRALLGLGVIVLLAALGWRLFGGSEPVPPGETRALPAAAQSDGEAASPPDRDALAAALVELTGFLATALGRVSDEASARAALPTLKEAYSRVGELGQGIDALDETDRQSLVPAVSAAAEELRPLAHRVLGTPGSGAVVEPVLVPLLKAIGKLAD